MEAIFRNHFKCLKKYVTSLNRQRDTLKCHFLEYHKLGKKFQDVFQVHWSPISYYLNMLETSQLTQIYQSRLLEMFGPIKRRVGTLSKNENVSGNEEMLLEENKKVILLEQEKQKNVLYQETSKAENEIKFQENTEVIVMEQEEQNNVLYKETPKVENYEIKYTKPEEKKIENIIEKKEVKTHESKVQVLEKTQNELQVMEENKKEIYEQNNKIKHSKSKEDTIQQSEVHCLERNENVSELMKKTNEEMFQQGNIMTRSKMIFKHDIKNCQENASKTVIQKKENQNLEKSQIIFTKYEEKQLETCKWRNFDFINFNNFKVETTSRRTGLREKRMKHFIDESTSEDIQGLFFNIF